jgi:hypothetical protein
VRGLFAFIFIPTIVYSHSFSAYGEIATLRNARKDGMGGVKSEVPDQVRNDKKGKENI